MDFCICSLIRICTLVAIDTAPIVASPIIIWTHLYHNHTLAQIESKRTLPKSIGLHCHKTLNMNYILTNS